MNWREEYKQFTSNKKELELLEKGPKSLAQSWHMQAMYNQWKRIKGISDDNPQLATPFQEGTETHSQTTGDEST